MEIVILIICGLIGLIVFGFYKIVKYLNKKTLENTIKYNKMSDLEKIQNLLSQNNMILTFNALFTWCILLFFLGK